MIKVGVWSHCQEPGMSDLNGTGGTMGSMIDQGDIAGKEMVGQDCEFLEKKVSSTLINGTYDKHMVTIIRGGGDQGHSPIGV